MCEILETKYIDTSFQVANRTEFPAKKIIYVKICG